MTAGAGIQFTAETNTVNNPAATIQTGSTGQFLGTMTNRGSITAGGSTTTGTALHNFGSVAISAGSLTLQGALDNHGAINVASGSMAVDKPHGGGGIFAQYTGASTTLNGGTGTATATRSILRAYAAGPGDADDPATTGTFTLNGNLIVTGIGSEHSRLEIELGGTTQGSSYDFFDVNGTASIDAVIDIRLVNSFQNSISASDVFTVLMADAPITGTVRNPWIGGPPGRVITADGLGSFLLSFSGNNLVLSGFSTAVPEPASMAVIAFAGAATGLARRRPRRRAVSAR
ncbi:MAG: subtilase-type serine protease [Humisphaera sp.]|nr:subtilase-type serine protease [Humisphaera sp.]